MQNLLRFGLVNRLNFVKAISTEIVTLTKMSKTEWEKTVDCRYTMGSYRFCHLPLDGKLL